MESLIKKQQINFLQMLLKITCFVKFLSSKKLENSLILEELSVPVMGKN